jgi:phage tail protein X
MAVPAERVTVNQDGLTLSNIVWRRFRATRPGLVEAILAANPGLAAEGPVLLAGTQFMMPVDPVETGSAQPVAVISLWD